jgi:hypothetical protein
MSMPSGGIWMTGVLAGRDGMLEGGPTLAEEQCREYGERIR